MFRWCIPIPIMETMDIIYCRRRRHETTSAFQVHKQLMSNDLVQPIMTIWSQRWCTRLMLEVGFFCYFLTIFPILCAILDLCIPFYDWNMLRKKQQIYFDNFAAFAIDPLINLILFINDQRIGAIENK